MISRRQFLKLSGAGVLSLYTASHGKLVRRAFAQIQGGTLHPGDVTKYVTPLLIPPVIASGIACNDCLGLRRGQVGQPKWVATAQCTLAHHRGPGKCTGTREMDQ